MANIFQAPLLTNFLYPLLLVFFICYAVLEKTKILGDENKQQINAAISLIVSLIFVGAVFPKLIVANMVQFMSVGLVIIFVGLVIWGFVSGAEDGKPLEGLKKPIFAWIVGIAMFFAILWATGAGGPLVDGLQKFLAFIFDSNWSGSFWTNALFIGIVAIAVWAVLKNSGDGNGGSSGDGK